jgi:hypothetical protein
LGFGLTWHDRLDGQWHITTRVMLTGPCLGLASSPVGLHDTTRSITGPCLGWGWEGTNPVGLGPGRPGLLARYTGRAGPSSMVLELRSCVQFPPAMHFLSLHVIILIYLAGRWGCTWLEHASTTHTQEGEEVAPRPFHIIWILWLDCQWGLSSTYNFKMVHIPFFFSVLDGAKKLNNIVSWSLLSLFCCRLTVPKGGCIIALYPNFISKDISSLIWVSRSKLVGYCCSCFLQNANNSIWTNQRWALWGLAQRTWWNNHKEETDMWKSQGPTASVQGL